MSLGLLHIVFVIADPSFFHLFNTYLLSTCCMLGTVLYVWEDNLCSYGNYTLVEKRDYKQKT